MKDYSHAFPTDRLLQLLDPSDEIHRELVKDVDEWVMSHPMFSDTRGVARIAIQEFLANQIGFTFYAHISCTPNEE